MSRDDVVRNETKEFLESSLGKHDCVVDIVEVSDREYRITRKYGDTIKLYITGAYVFGVFEFDEVMQNSPDVNCIVLASKWLNYTGDAKDAAKDRSIGLFDISELFGALNRQHQFWNYEKPKKRN